ncbi:MAG: ribonuclease P protein component [bacterium]|nr:ribonuclease P protein component [bacterium]
MLKTERLRRSEDFAKVYKQGRSVAGRQLVLYWLTNSTEQNRLGISAGKKLGGAVVRNRVKRLMREGFRSLSLNVRAGHDLVIIARSVAVGANFSEVRRELEALLKRQRLWQEIDE